MSLTINDGKATPVAHVFTQDSVQNGSTPTEHVNRSNTDGPSFWERVRSLVTLGKSANAKHVFKAKLTRPIPGVDADGKPIVVDTHEMIITLLVGPKAAAESSILDTLAMGANLLDNSTFRTQVKSLAPVNIP